MRLALYLLALAASLPLASASEVRRDSTADHSRFEILQQDFSDGPAVTRACLSCHTEASKQVHDSLHWTWSFTNAAGQQLGKRHVVNNFCGNLDSNEPRCTSCHVGYGWKDDGFDFSAEDRVDCLVCHDTTGSYQKHPELAGHPVYAGSAQAGAGAAVPDLGAIARAVGPSSRQTCGSCHFNGGGGDGVKHGDLDSSLIDAHRVVDVHMDSQGWDFSCAKCHTTHGHQIPGSRYAGTARDTRGTGVPGSTRRTASCESCHGLAPHPGDSLATHKLNDHIDRIACQTCHIPAFARGGIATKTAWDWSTVGRMDEYGNPIKEQDAAGRVIYSSHKGDFAWGENIEPSYRWYNGESRWTLIEDPIDPSQPVPINRIEGDAKDPGARIWPFKVMTGRQPYDAQRNTLLLTHVYGDDDSALWNSHDWTRAIDAGMASRDLSWSGELGFVDTEMHWPITHMVAPAYNALDCGECHARDGRLAEIEGVYIPGRDRSLWLDRMGQGLILAALAFVLIHGLARIGLALRRRAK